MNQKIAQDYDLLKEKISALLDDELCGPEQENTLKLVSKDEKLADLWHRYHVIGASCRRELTSSPPGLLHRVANLVRHESRKITALRSKRFRLSRDTANWIPITAVAVSSVLAIGLGIYLTSVENTHVKINEISTTAVDGSTRWVNSNPEHEDRLNAFLVEHGEFTPMSGLNGLISYAKFVSYDEK